MRVFAQAVSSALVILLLLVPGARAQDAAADAAIPVETTFAPVVRAHEARVGGRALRYTSTVEETEIRADDGEVTGRIFSTAYTLSGVSNPAERPVTFVFNGGPGSASVWLHMGALGPRRVVMSAEGETLPPPGALQDNPDSWLDLTDLVFIDPVGTGYSRAAEGSEQADFSGVRQDAESVAEFIRLYLTRNNRWLSPKFLAGESYGTTRAAALTGVLLDQHNIALNGVFLISAIMDFSTARFSPGNNLPYALFLPTYTATAWFHNRLPADLQRRDLADVLAEVRDWARTDYLVALAQGSRLSDRDAADLARQLARYTGLTEDALRETNLRVNIQRFCKELLRDQRRTVGRLDSRYTGIDRDAAGETPDQDPSFTAILGPYTVALQAYLRTELGVERDDRYHILNWNIGPWEWNYAGGDNSFVNVAETLRRSMSRNPHMLVHVAAGYYDLATPFFAAEYTVDQMLLEPELRGNVIFDYYRSGHMMYVRDADLAKLKADVARVFERSRQQRGPAFMISTQDQNR